MPKVLAKYMLNILSIVIVLSASSSFASVNTQCQRNLTSFAPLSSDQFSKAQQGAITPQDVYIHTLKLKNRLETLGLTANSNAFSIETKNVLPEHNLNLAFDIFNLVQIWQQQKSRRVTPVAQLLLPDTIEPTHIFSWVDSTHAYLNCHNLSTNLAKNQFRRVKNTQHSQQQNATSEDVFHLLVNVTNSILSDIEPRFVYQLINLKLRQITYQLQDTMVATKQHQFVNWQKSNQTLSREKLMQRLLPILERVLQLNVSSNFQFSLSANLQPNNQIANYLIVSIIQSQLQNISLMPAGYILPPMIETVQSAHVYQISEQYLEYIEQLVMRLNQSRPLDDA